jgi:hypothetical protein
VQRFSDLMEEMCTIVATKHSGALRVLRTRALCGVARVFACTLAS